MSDKKNIDYTDDKIIQEIYECANNTFGHGIAVPSNSHPCGWDWIDFEGMDNVLTDKIFLADINDGSYDYHEFDGLMLKEILAITEGKFLFEINCNVDWE